MVKSSKLSKLLGPVTVPLVTLGTCCTSSWPGAHAGAEPRAHAGAAGWHAAQPAESILHVDTS